MLKRTCSLLLLRKSFFFYHFRVYWIFTEIEKKNLLQMCHVYVYVCINWTKSFYVFWFFMFMSSVEFKPGVNLTSIFVVLVIFFKVWSSRRNKLAPFCLYVYEHSCRPFRSPKYLFHKLLVTALRINWVIKLSIFAGYLRAPSGAHLGLIRLPGRYHCLSPPRQRPAVCQ